LLRAEGDHWTNIMTRKADYRERKNDDGFGHCEFHVHAPGEKCHSTGLTIPVEDSLEEEIGEEEGEKGEDGEDGEEGEEGKGEDEELAEAEAKDDEQRVNEAAVTPEQAQQERSEETTEQTQALARGLDEVRELGVEHELPSRQASQQSIQIPTAAYTENHPDQRSRAVVPHTSQAGKRRREEVAEEYLPHGDPDERHYSPPREVDWHKRKKLGSEVPQLGGPAEPKIKDEEDKDVRSHSRVVFPFRQRSFGLDVNIAGHSYQRPANTAAEGSPPEYSYGSPSPDSEVRIADISVFQGSTSNTGSFKPPPLPVLKLCRACNVTLPSQAALRKHFNKYEEHRKRHHTESAKADRQARKAANVSAFRQLQSPPPANSNPITQLTNTAIAEHAPDFARGHETIVRSHRYSDQHSLLKTEPQDHPQHGHYQNLGYSRSFLAAPGQMTTYIKREDEMVRGAFESSYGRRTSPTHGYH
jgi:hypothetical protein